MGSANGDKLRIGVIGYGGRASGILGMLVEVDPSVRVVAVADLRAEQIKAKNHKMLAGAAFYPGADELLANGPYDGLLIGTNDHTHAGLACRVAETGIPLYLEKPVATAFDQVGMLMKAASSFRAPVVVSFPLRLSPLVTRTRELIAAGTIGRIENVVAFNDVPYGADSYFASWYRDPAKGSGLFLQKATHDLDYLAFIVDSPAKWVCAMKCQRVFGGRADRPFDLKCRDCGDKGTCPESPFNGDSMISPESRERWKESRACLFSKGIKNEDSGMCLVEYESGVQASYTQNFYARYGAGRRGARIHGYQGTIEFDWYTGKITVMKHDRPGVETMDMAGDEAHFGGDPELCREFVAIMKGKKDSRSPLRAGIASALTGLCAIESAESRRFREVRLP
jgi:predicted dehydrogenase